MQPLLLDAGAHDFAAVQPCMHRRQHVKASMQSAGRPCACVGSGTRLGILGKCVWHCLQCIAQRDALQVQHACSLCCWMLDTQMATYESMHAKRRQKTCMSGSCLYALLKGVLDLSLVVHPQEQLGLAQH